MCLEVCRICQGAGSLWWGQLSIDQGGWPAPSLDRPVQCWECGGYGGPLLCLEHGLTDRMHHQKLDFVEVTPVSRTAAFGSWRCRWGVLHSDFVSRTFNPTEAPFCDGRHVMHKLMWYDAQAGLWRPNEVNHARA